MTLSPTFSALIRWLAGATLALCALPPAHAGKYSFSTPEAEAEYHVLAGEFAAGRNQPELAAQEFLKALAVAPDPELATRATGLALAAKNDDLALVAARRWLEVDPTNLDPREVIVRLAVRKGLLDEAYMQAVSIIKDNTGGEDDGFRHVALLVSQESGGRDAALDVMQRLQKQWPKLPDAYYALGLTALRFSKLDLAEQAARDALRLAPDSREALLLLTGVQVKRGDLTAADLTLEGALKNAPNAAELRLSYVKLLLEAGQQNHAIQQLQLMLQANPNNVDAHYALGLLALERQNTDEAEPHFLVLIKQGDHSSEAAYYLGRIEEVRSHPELALKWYKQVTRGNQTIDASVRSAALLGRSGKLEDARGLLEQLRRQYPPLTSRFYLAEGEILLDVDAVEQALEVYETALDLTPDDPDLLYGLSLVHERMQKVDLAEADLRRLLEQDKDDARALNALGYMLTVHTTRLMEAKKLISRALELTPDDAAVIDSMGWVEFRMGNSKAARVWLQKAFDKMHDPEIAAHLGEVMWSLGEKEQARALLESALQDDPNHRVLRETVQRLTQQ